MTDFVPPDFRLALGDPDQVIIYDIASNWALAQHPTAIDFELLYTAVDAMAQLQLTDLAALAFVPHQNGRGLIYKGETNVIGSPEWARPHAASLRERLKTMVHDRVGTVDPTASASLFGPLFSSLFDFTSGATELRCFTTNYDRSVESIWEADLQAGIKGTPVLARGFVQLSPNRGLELDLKSYERSPENHKVIKLYKLHGGLNWIQEGSHTFESPTNDYVRRNAVVYPLRKHALDEPFRSLIATFRTTLGELHILVVVGNSLRDEHLRDALVQAMTADSRFKVVVLDPNASNIKETFGKEFDESIFPASVPFGDPSASVELIKRLNEGVTYGRI